MRMENRGFENGIYLFDVKNRKDERKRVTLKSFHNCLFGARSIYLFDVKNRGESFDYTKVPQVVETGWHVFKLCPMTMDKNERKRVTLKSFDDCLQEKTMEELCQSFAELSMKN